jgi:hypothetical protein
MAQSSDDKERDEVLRRMLAAKPTPQKKLKEEIKARRDAGDAPKRGRPKSTEPKS